MKIDDKWENVRVGDTVILTDYDGSSESQYGICKANQIELVVVQDDNYCCKVEVKYPWCEQLVGTSTFGAFKFRFRKVLEE